MRASTLSPVRADDQDLFNAARLLLVFLSLKRANNQRVSVDRLIYYEFYSSHPYLLFTFEDAEWGDLVVTGFELTTVSYNSPSHKFVSERERIKAYLAALTSRGLISAAFEGGRIVYIITPIGEKAATEIRSLYASAYLKSAGIVIRRLKRLSDTALARESRRLLSRKALLFDL